MTDKSSNAIKILKLHYGIVGEPDDIYETFDLSSATTHRKHSEDYEVKNFGYFEKQRFRVGADKKYNLIFCESSFTEDDELISWMNNSEMITIKSYQLVEQILPIENYFLYQLIPHTVQGIPAW